MEDKEWNWNDSNEIKAISKEPKLEFPNLDKIDESNKDLDNEMVDEIHVRGTHLLADVYQRCDIVVCESANFEEANYLIKTRWLK
jgi:hypothetical protein